MKRKRKWETVKTKDQQTIRLKFPFKHFASRWEHLSGDATRNNRIQIPDIDSIKYANPIFLRFSIRSIRSRFMFSRKRFTFYVFFFSDFRFYSVQLNLRLLLPWCVTTPSVSVIGNMRCTFSPLLSSNAEV